MGGHEMYPEVGPSLGSTKSDRPTDQPSLPCLEHRHLCRQCLQLIRENNASTSFGSWPLSMKTSIKLGLPKCHWGENETKSMAVWRLCISSGHLLAWKLAHYGNINSRMDIIICAFVSVLSSVSAVVNFKPVSF